MNVEQEVSSEQTMTGDIETCTDIDQLVAAFYARVLPDPIIGFFFTDVARIDLPTHLPKISAFWQQQLLGKPTYRGQLFAAHQHIQQHAALSTDHFHRWLTLFTQSIDELFSGPRADAAKHRAARIAESMQAALANRHPYQPEAQAGNLQFYNPDEP